MGNSNFTHELLRQAHYPYADGSAKALILAAQMIEDLLAALKELNAAAYPHWANNHSPSATEIARTCDAWVAARDAIAKTEEVPW
jgi:hypothetical protein